MARILLSATSPPSSSSLAVAEPPLAISVESDFVVILAALLCALICVVGLIAVARCAWLRRGSNAGGVGRCQPSANRGLKKKVVQSLPRYTFDSSSSENAGSATTTSDCVICLTEYADGDEIRVLPQCGHRFHVQCIDMWLGSHSSCPSCRQILVVARCHKCGEFPSVSGVRSQIPPAPPVEIPSKASGLPSSSSTLLP